MRTIKVRIDALISILVPNWHTPALRRCAEKWPIPVIFQNQRFFAGLWFASCIFSSYRRDR